MNPAEHSARADAERSGTVVGGDVDRIEAAIFTDIAGQDNAQVSPTEMGIMTGAGACANTPGVADPVRRTNMAKRTCSVDGCEKPLNSQGLCSMHRWRRANGADFSAAGDLRLSPPNKGRAWIEAMVATALAGDDDECITTWPFSRLKFGYATLSVGGQRVCAHVVVLEMTSGPRPAGHVARHLCGNGHLGCLHPHHLVWGTPAENMQDMALHGRVAGERNAHAKLTEAAVRYIKQSSEPGVVLAERFGVSPSAISLVRQGKTWSHVEATDLAGEAAWRCPHDRSGSDRDTATYCPAAKLVTPAEAEELWGAWLTGEGRPATVHTRLRCGHTSPGICTGSMWCAECVDFSPVAK